MSIRPTGRRVAALVMVLIASAAVTAQESAAQTAPQQSFAFTPAQRKALDELKKQVEATGSNLSFTMLALQKHKFLHDAGAAAGEPRAEPADSAYDLNRLRGFLGAASLSAAADPSAYFVESSRRHAALSTLTGMAAVSESLQLDTIGASSTDDTKRSKPLNSIERLKIPTHPWAKMLKQIKAENAPEIFKLAPSDHFVVYFEQPDQIKELESIVRELAAAGAVLADFSKLLQVRSSVAARLGIAGFEELEPLVEELAFVSEDLSFISGTEYALILRFKADVLAEAAKRLLRGNRPHASVGPFLVLSTSNDLLKRIRSTNAGKVRSLSDAGDFRYMLSTLDQRRNGFAYLSEDFILKLVSPAYRINSARRARATETLESLQYTVLAYRILTGRWPDSWQEMATAGFVEEISQFKDFSLDASGVVRSKDWGSLFDLRSLSEVKIAKVSLNEKRNYEQFRENYMQLWTRFFDPIALTFLAGEQFYLQLVVRPLINNSEYRELLQFTGGLKGRFSSLQAPLRAVPVQLSMKLDFDDLLLQMESGRRVGDEQLNPEQLKSEANARIQRGLGLDPATDVFDMVGNEIFIGFGPDAPKNLADTTNLDAFVGLKLKDTARFNSFIEKFCLAVFGSGKSTAGGGLQKKTHRDKDYYLLRTPLLSLSYLFYDNFAYFAFSEFAAQRLIDSIGTRPRLGDYPTRALKYLGRRHSLLFIMELNQLNWRQTDLFAQAGAEYRRNQAARNLSSYLHDVQIVAEALKDESAVKRFFPTFPDSVLGVDIRFSNDSVILGGGGKMFKLRDVRFPKRYGPDRRTRSDQRVEFFKLVNPMNTLRSTQVLEKMEGLAVGISLSEEGLEARIALDNPLIEPPPRAVEESRWSQGLMHRPVRRPEPHPPRRKGFGADIALSQLRRIETLRNAALRSAVINICLGTLLAVIVLLALDGRARKRRAAAENAADAKPLS